MVGLLILLAALELPAHLFSSAPQQAVTTQPVATATQPTFQQQLSQDPTLVAQQYANDLLTWVGFGTLVGLAAKAIMPGRDPGGAVATLAMGIGGTIIGCGALMYFKSGERVSPISPPGFAVATAGAFVLLFFYRLLGGKYFYEGDGGLRNTYQPYRRRRRVDLSQYYD